MQRALQFQWAVARQGYRWIRGADGGWAITEQPPPEWRVGEKPPQRWYVPGEEKEKSALFLDFAGTAPSKQGIEAFASRSGLLGLRDDEKVQAEEDPCLSGEPLDEWKRHIKTVAAVVEVWERTKVGDVQGLQALEKTEHHFTDPGSLGRGGEDRLYFYLGPEIAEQVAQGQLLEPAMFWLRDVIEEQLEQFVHPRLLFDPSRRALSLVTMPRSLLGAIWLQLASAVTQPQKSFGRCRICGTPFEISRVPGGSRTDRQFCSKKCRFRAYRDRQAEAVRLNKEGVTLREIAKRLDSDTKTVRGWIVKARTATKVGVTRSAKK